MFNNPIRLGALGLVCLLSACGDLTTVGKAPALSAPTEGRETVAMQAAAFAAPPRRASDARASLWTGHRGSLLGERRAERRGDILTVVIEIDDQAEISNSSDRSRSSSQSMDLPNLFGLPQRLNARARTEADMTAPVGVGSSLQDSGDGQVRRNERLTLRVAATVVDVLPNGALAIEGTQEVRVNFELRELLVTGFVRPEDVSRSNEISYDKIAAARISYGGRGQISQVQQPRYGQQILDMILPF